MDEKGGIYSLDFKFITNMEDNKIEIEDEWIKKCRNYNIDRL